MNHIQYIHINNFKSIRDLKIEDCRRINLFIGYPNVGKSNILEALSLFTVPYLENGDSLKKIIRADSKYEILYNASGKSCFVATNTETAQVDILPELTVSIGMHEIGSIQCMFTDDLEFDGCAYTKEYHKEWPVKRYIFSLNKKWRTFGNALLTPPFGENLLETLLYNPDTNSVKIWMKGEFEKQGLEYILDKTSSSVKMQRRLNNEEVFQMPYESIADTLQRIIFYKTAILSNKNSTLLFEEPEAHAFPPYISTITNDIINSESNQFFITTHSPFVINDFIEEKRDDVALYIVDYKDGQTITRKLTDKELDEVYNYGIDLFFNIENYLK